MKCCHNPAMLPRSTLIKLTLLILLSQSISAALVSRHITAANFIGKIHQLNTHQNLSFFDRRAEFIKTLLTNEELTNIAKKEIRELGFLDKRRLSENNFPCKNYSVHGSGTNINNLTPGDINVIAALGDSLTAGLGLDANTILGLLWEDKGKVFDIGGVSNCGSLTNFLKVYNSNIKGFSMSRSFMRSKIDGFNVAVSGATSKDVLQQVEILIDLLKSSKSIDFNNDWKLINIFIGNNDICRSCEKENMASFTPELFKERLLIALDKLQAEVPRAFVSLVTMLDVFEVHNLNRGLVCCGLHLYECPCVAFSADIDSVIKVTNEFQYIVRDIGQSGRYDTTDDFVVVTQPFFEETNIPYIDGQPDLSYFAPDCFHLSEKGDSQVALSLWNSLFEPIKTKRNSWHVDEQFECPSFARPYFATPKNAP